MSLAIGAQYLDGGVADVSLTPSPSAVQLWQQRPVVRGFTPRSREVSLPLGTDMSEVLAAMSVVIFRSNEDRELIVAQDHGDTAEFTIAHYPDGGRFVSLLNEIDQGLNDPYRLEFSDLVGMRRQEAGQPAVHLEFTSEKGRIGRLSDIAIVEEDGRFELVVNGTLYTEQDVARLAHQISAVLAAEDPDSAIDDFSLVTGDLLRKVRDQWNDTSRQCPDEYVHEVVARIAEQNPDRIAVEESESFVTYRQLQDEVDELVSALARVGAGPHAPIGLLLDRSVHAIAAHLAAFRTSCPLVLLDPEHPAERIRFYMQDSRVVAAISTSRFAELLPEGVKLIDVNDPAKLKPESPAISRARPNAEDVAHIAYTSGSSGLPKAVQLRYGPMRQLTHTLIEQCGLDTTARGTWLSAASLGMVEVDVLPVLSAGGTVVLCPQEIATDAARLHSWIHEARVSHTLVITSLAEVLWSMPWSSNTPLRHMRVAGERCRSWPSGELPFTVLNVYGSSEATVVATGDLTEISRQLSESEKTRREPPVGRPVDNVRMYVLDERYRPVPPGVIGTLFVSGESLSRGYLEREDVDNSVFETNVMTGDPYPVLYRTGDLARYWDDGTIDVTGRNDDLVKVRGYRVSLGEIEAQLLRHPSVAQSAVQTVQTSTGDVQLAAYVEPESGISLGHSELRSYLSDRLPTPMIPARFLCTKLPRANGKIDRKNLPEISDERPDTDTPYVAAATEHEKILIGIWEEALGFSGLGAMDNFFELGGDSLRGMRVIANLSEQYGLSLQLQDLQANPTPRHCAPHLVNAESEALPQATPDPDNAGTPFALNDSQQALWIGRGAAVELGNVGCHGYFEWDNPNLDLARFRQAWIQLVQRHGMLRTVILADGRQQVLTDVDAGSFTVDDLSGLTQDEADAWVDQLREQMSHQVLDCSRWPLYELRVSELPNGHSRIHLSLDMLIVDAWSLYQALIPDLIELYENPENSLPELEIGFRDYSIAREKIWETEAYDRARRYWMDRLDTMPVAPALPRAAEQPVEHRFDRLEVDIPAEKWSALKEFGREHNVTASGIVVAAFAEVLRAWSSDDQFTINFPVSDRMPLHPQVDALVGDFTNTLLVAVEKVDGTILDRAQSIQTEIWRNLEHRHFSGVEVLREIARREGGSLRPAMPIVLTSLLGHPGRRSSSDLGRECFGVSQTPQVLLDVQLREIDGVLHIKWDHLPDAFPAGMIKAMFGSFCELISRLENSQTWEAEYLDLRPMEQIAARETVNSTESPVLTGALSELFVKRVADSAGSVAIVAEDETLTWRDLGSAAEAVARRLENAGCASSGPVGIVIPKGWQQYAAIHGVQLTGNPYVPLDPSQPDSRLVELLDSSGAQAVVCVPGTTARISAVFNGPLVEVTTEDAGETVSPRRRHDSSADDTAYIIYTSGSTGKPKGVAVAHRSVINHVTDASQRFGLNEADRHLATAGIHFDMSVFDVFAPLVHGGSVVIPRPASGPDPDRWLELAATEGVTFWTAVPALMDMACQTHQRMLARGNSSLLALRNVVLAGDWIALDLPDRVRTMAPGCQVTSAGGPTETTNWSIAYDIDSVDSSWTSIPYGKPMANARYHIVDDRLRHRPDWSVGEMVVEGEVVLAQGYWNDPVRTAERFVTDPVSGKRWYRTGDLGRYRPDGNIEILGRNDFQIKINGHRIEIGEVEHALCEINHVVSAAVVAVSAGQGQQRLVAWVVVDRDGVPVDEIAGGLRNALPQYMVPGDIRVIRELPLTENGKVDRQRLARDSSQVYGNTIANAPSDAASEVARVICECAAVLLELDDVSAHANFFSVGGDSLSAMRLASLTSDALDCEVALAEVLQTATLRELASAIENDPERADCANTAARNLMAASSEL